MKSKWILVDDGNGLSGSWVPLNWKSRVAVAMGFGGIFGFFAGVVFMLAQSHVVP